MLNRIDGETAEYEGNFNDVSDGDWFCKNVAWAVKNGITYGVTQTSFAPSAQITRQEMAVMITRYLSYKQLTPEVVNEDVYKRQLLGTSSPKISVI